MYKLLVADDEPRQVKALANIISQLRPDYELYTAADGEEALEIIKNKNIDILLIDIRMPNMDGLQLIEKLTETGINIRTIIISGYGEFEYAQKAIRFGVNGYIVKPISKAEIQEILDKVEHSLAEEREWENQNKELKKKLNNSLPVYIEHQLNRWIGGKLNETELSEIESLFPANRYGTVLVVSFGNCRNLPNGLDNETKQYLKFRLKQVLDAVGHSISFFLEGESNTMATVLVSDDQYNLKSNDNISRLTQYIESVRNELDITVSMGLSDKSHSFPGDTAELFQKALKALEQRFFAGCGRIIFYSDLTIPQDGKPADLNIMEAEISEAVRRRDKSAVSGYTGAIFGSINVRRLISVYQFKEDLLHLLLNQAKVVSSLLREDERHAFISDIKTCVIQCEEYKELWHLTNRILYRIIDVLNNNLNDKNALIIEKCKKYIDENYMEDISLESISRKYYFNPSYFSNLFKSHTGIGFSEYLLGVRIKKAQQLLKYSEDSMSEVSKKVGFKDQAYFNRMFKREVGISPLKFRQMNESR